MVQNLSEFTFYLQKTCTCQKKAVPLQADYVFASSTYGVVACAGGSFLLLHVQT